MIRHYDMRVCVAVYQLCVFEYHWGKNKKNCHLYCLVDSSANTSRN